MNTLVKSKADNINRISESTYFTIKRVNFGLVQYDFINQMILLSVIALSGVNVTVTVYSLDFKNKTELKVSMCL